MKRSLVLFGVDGVAPEGQPRDRVVVPHLLPLLACGSTDPTMTGQSHSREQGSHKAEGRAVTKQRAGQSQEESRAAW